MFDDLWRVASRPRRSCPRCARPLELELEFSFGLGASDKHLTVLGAFLPEEPEEWNDDGAVVTYYPFLVVGERRGRESAMWLPYWHVIERGGRQVQKYGQWAPFMDARLFQSLLSQAVRAGLLKVS